MIFHTVLQGFVFCFFSPHSGFRWKFEGRGEKSINLANLKQGGPFAEFLALRILSLYLYVHYK